ncbi:unnamed protein product [Phytophthora fragariaefolia]|uniref:Unnamed protein product n=1 Tax=Phytophthora fragariaefolia TaxID=1490495 RepID=A0A9W6Y5A5_9STRA|nr:unnamed protein product [Phytophthora fragariaefolia]
MDSVATSRRTRATETYYRVRCLGFPSAEDTWEPRERLMKNIPDILKEYEATLALVFDDGSLEHNHDRFSVIAQEYPRHESMGNDSAVVTDISDDVPAKSRGARHCDGSDDNHTRGIDMDISAVTLTTTRVAAASTAKLSTSRPVEAASPAATVTPAPRVSLEGSGAASVPSPTTPSSPSIYRSSATHALTLADLERILERRDNRLEFAQVEGDIKMGKLISYAVAKLFPEPTHELFHHFQGSSSIDELIAVLEKAIGGGPHPAVVASEQ